MADLILLFGDQTNEVLPSIEELNRHALRSSNLRSFISRSTDRLRASFARAPAAYRRSLPSSFETPLELATWAASQTSGPLLKCSPALAATLLCLAQIGHIIVELEANPCLLDHKAKRSTNTVLLGTCTGLLAAIAVACSDNLADLLAIADEIVDLAFNIGLESVRRTATIDDASTATTSSWATLVTNISDIAAVEEALADFNATSVLSSDRQAYISARGLTSSVITISGPPSTTAALFSSSSSAAPALAGTKLIPLGICAAFHAPHLQPVALETTLSRCSLSSSLAGRSLRSDIILMSAGHGRQYEQGAPFADALTQALHDIFQEPIAFEAVVTSLTNIITPTVILATFGPANATRAIARQLESIGVTVACTTNSISAPSDDDAASTSASFPAPPGDDAIAIVGMASRLPGSETLEEFWQVLEKGLDLHEPIRPDRFDVDSHCDITGQRRNTSLSPYGVFIDRPGYFDTRLFNMSPREAAQTDPQQRLLLLTTYEALEMAGYAPDRTPSTAARRIGSFVGQTSDDYRDVNASQDVDTYFITGGIRAFGPGRLNYHFGWEGPSYSVDTACSSSAASIQLACTSLLSRECDTAVAGGANFLTSSDLFAGLSRGSFLSKTGGCKTFDAAADGYVRADGVAVIVLKRLSDAVADNDNILAVVRSAVTNHSAEAVSITHPHAATQERLFRAALNRAGLHPHDIDYAELHGTGTQAGDATESRSVTNVLTPGRGPAQPLYVGTVKPNIGHGEAASGVTSLMKAVLMMRNNAIPPHIGIKGTMNPKLPVFSELNTHIAFKTTPFLPRSGGDGKRRILINNFDAAGGNTSIIMEDAPACVSAITSSDPRSHHIVAVSGRTANALIGNNQRLLDFVRKNPGTKLADLSYTTTARRIHQGLRQTHVAATLDGLVTSLEAAARDEEKMKKARAPQQSPSVVFCFTGQGSQYAGMASELFASQPTFRETLLECDRVATTQGFESFLSLVESETAETALASASPIQVQLAIVSIELALAALWKSIGVVPTAVIGHSLGEYAALCTAGVLSLSDCLYLVGRRASLMLSSCTPGTQSMLALACSLADAEALLRSSLAFASCEIACANGPSSTVVSGPAANITELQKATTVKSTLLDVQFAFHSAQMDPVIPAFGEYTAKAHYASPSIPFASTLLGTVVDSTAETPVIDGSYLVRQMRERVRFTDALESLLDGKLIQTSQSVWIETGPSPICIGIARSTLSGHAGISAPLLLASLKRGESDWKMFAQAAAKVHEAGVKVDWQEYHAAFESSLRLLELPTYAFDLKNYWIQYRGDWALRKGDLAIEPASSIAPEPKVVSYPAFEATTGLHRIESQVVSDDGSIAVTFATDAIEPKLNKALRGHLVNGAGLCPSSVLGDMALTGSNYIRRLSHLLSDKAGSVSPLGNDLCLDVHGMGIHKPLLIQPGETKQIILTTAVWDAPSSTVVFTFSSRDGPDGAQEEHAHCKATFTDGNAWTSLWKRSSYLVRGRMDQLVEAAATGRAHKLLRPMVYKLFASFVDYADKYQGLQEVYMDSHQLEAAANVKFRTNDSDGTFTCSPYWIDGFAHLSGFILNGADTAPADSVFISHGWGSMKFTCAFSADKSYRSYVRMQEEAGSKGVFSGDVFFFEGDEVIAMCEDLKFQRVKRSILAYLLPSGAAPTAAPARPSAPMRSSAPMTPPPSPPRKSAASKTSRSAKRPSTPKKAVISQSSLLFSEVLDAVASEVGIEVGELTDDAWFADLGVDSLLAISITAKLSTLMGRHLPATLFTECLSVSHLRTYFATELGAGSDPFVGQSNEVSWSTPPQSEPGSDDEGSDASPSATVSRNGTPYSSIGQTPDPGAASDHSSELFRKIIAQEVGVDASEIEDDTLLADLGVDSLLSLSILGTIKVQTGRVLPSSFLIDHPTLNDIQNVLGGHSHTSPRELAQAVEKAATHTAPERKSSATKHTAEAILLQGSPRSKSPALFLLPDGSGSASSYVGLPPMSLKGAVYGLNSPFLKNPEEFSIPLQDVASLYVDEIRRVQPSGPYHLGGWSIGGSYAFEVASQLVTRHGEHVSSLILIDAPCPKTLPPLPTKTIDLLNKIGAFDGLKGRASNNMRSGVREHFAGSVNALKQYKPVPIPSQAVPKTVSVLWARDGVWETVGEDVRRQNGGIQGGINAAEDWIMDPRKDKGPNGWESLLPGASIACRTVPGDHFTIMRRPRVAELGEQVRCSVSE